MASLINTTSSKWLDAFQDTPVLKLVSTLKIPIYHINTKKWTDMGYDSKGRRKPYVDSIDVYIWSSKDSKPIVYKYSVDPHDKSSYLESIYTHYLQIKDLRVLSDDEEWFDPDDPDDVPEFTTAHQLYSHISNILGVNSDTNWKTLYDSVIRDIPYSVLCHGCGARKKNNT